MFLPTITKCLLIGGVVWLLEYGLYLTVWSSLKWLLLTELNMSVFSFPCVQGHTKTLLDPLWVVVLSFFSKCMCVGVCVCNALIAWRTSRLPAGSKQTGSEKKKWQRMKRVSMKEIKCRKERFKGLVHPIGKTWKVCLKADGLPEEDDKEKVRGERQKRHWWQISKDRLGTVGLERWN